jgi:hypothetical protein
MSAPTLAGPAAQTLLDCAAGCGTPLHPAAAAGGHTVHPGCEARVPTTSVGWTCVRCGLVEDTISTTLGVAMSVMHDMYACPMTATSEDEVILRIGRRANLTRLYPGIAPPVTARRVNGRMVAVLGGRA